MFEIVGTKSLDSNAIEFKEDGINFVGRTFENNGIQGKIDKREFEPNEPYTITATVIGNYKYVKYQVEPYYCSQNINKLTPKSIITKWNEKIAYYFITNIQKFVSLYDNQQGGYKLNDIKNHIISLPMKNNTIDFCFMESLISELEEERISELSAYLKVSGLDNYELSSDEINTLNKVPKMKTFNIVNDVFNVKNTHNILSSWITPNSGINPYVTAGEENNSVLTYIDYDINQIEKGNGIMIGGKTLVVTYQEKDYYSNDSHNLALYLKDDITMNEDIAMYLVSALYKSLKPIYSWGDSISGKKIKKDIISLPIKDNESIDYEYMEKYIKAIKKLVIKNVVLWKDKVIEKTKEII